VDKLHNFSCQYFFYLIINTQLCVNTEEEMVEKKIENEEEDTWRWEIWQR